MKNTASEDNTYIQISVPSGNYIRVRRIVCIGGNGANLVNTDMQTMIKFLVCSTGAANQIALTISEKNPLTPASFCTVTGKNLTDTASVPGTLVRTCDITSWWSSNFFEWSETRGGEGFVVNGPNYFVVALREGSAAGNSKSVSCVWEEF